jgi:hypothetical protein
LARGGRHGDAAYKFSKVQISGDSGPGWARDSDCVGEHGNKDQPGRVPSCDTPRSGTPRDSLCPDGSRNARPAGLPVRSPGIFARFPAVVGIILAVARARFRNGVDTVELQVKLRRFVHPQQVILRINVEDVDWASRRSTRK